MDCIMHDKIPEISDARRNWRMQSFDGYGPDSAAREHYFGRWTRCGLNVRALAAMDWICCKGVKH